MEKEYVTARLFRNRETDCHNSDDECQDLDQQPSTQTWSHDSKEAHEKAEAKGTPIILSLPERIINIVKKVLARLIS